MVLLLTYVLVLIIEIFLLSVCRKKKTAVLWWILIAAECLSIVAALYCYIYYNFHYGSNFAGFFEALFSFIATLFYGVLLIISLYMKRKK